MVFIKLIFLQFWGVAKWSKAPDFDSGISEVRILPPQPLPCALIVLVLGALALRRMRRVTG